MADEWSPLLSHRHAAISVREQPEKASTLFQIPQHCILTRADNELLLQPISRAEVTEATHTLGQHKAAGSDRLNNDFFRDHGEAMADYLATMFSKIIGGSAIPASFREAVIVPIPKGGDAAEAMNYRPIALLQSSYKLFTKILATRLQRCLGLIINADQNGFVRGREMTNNLHLMNTVLKAAYNDPTEDAETVPVVLLLDFKKAYDTLDRDFLSHALEAFGLDRNFVDLIVRLHDNTTANFLVNGDLSTTIPVTTGIRQGCPLAPLLFLIAVETLKYAIEQTQGVEGIDISGLKTNEHHVFSAFVDDSVVFLRETAMIAAVTKTLHEYAMISGLQVQPTKCQAILLNTAVATTQVGSFPVVAVGRTATYLGIEIGVGSDLALQNWNKRITKLHKHIGHATQHTTSMNERVAVLNTVALPGVLFVAKHHTPPSEILKQLDALWRQYLWYGTVTSKPTRAHKIAPSLLALPRTDLGLGLIDFRAAMVEQAARMITVWNTKTPAKYWAITHDLIAAAGATTLNHTARVNAQIADHYRHPDYLARQKSELLALLHEPARGLQWITTRVGRFTIPEQHREQWTRVSVATYAAMPPEIRSFWGTFPWADNTWVTGVDGTPSRRSDYPDIQIDAISELQLSQNPDGSYQFQTPTAKDALQLRPSQRHRLCTWLCLVILSTGLPHHDMLAGRGTRVYSNNGHAEFDLYEWHIDAAGEMMGRTLSEKWAPGAPATTPIRANCAGWGQPVTFDQQQAEEALARLTNTDLGLVILSGHPLVHHGPALLPPRERYKRAPTSQDLHTRSKSTTATRRARADGLTRAIARLEHLLTTDEPVYTAILSSPLWTTTGTTDYQRSFHYRLHLGALNTRDNTGSPMRCPHGSCSQENDDLTIAHVIWHCPGARRTWTAIWSQWTGRELRRDEAPPLDHCLGATTPPLAHAWRRDLHDTGHDHKTIEQACKVTWTVIRTVLPHRLWLIRNEAAFHTIPDQAPKAIALKTWYTAREQLRSIATSARTTADTQRLGVCIQQLIDHIDTTRAATQVKPDRVRLYYDGGSRGNPGNSGSGSVILHQATPHTEWHIVWWDYHHLRDDQTNNYAEHTGLARGLQACADLYENEPILIDAIGDSLLVTRQLRHQARTTGGRFQKPLQRTRSALRRLHAVDFHHTLRTGNTMADWLANQAMDHGTSSASSTHTDERTTTERELRSRLTNDTTHQWTEDRSHVRTLPRLKTQLAHLHTLSAPITKRPRTSRPAPQPLTKRPRTTK